MMWPGWIGRYRSGKRRSSVEINIWRLQSIFQNFRRILTLNNSILEDMDFLERTLGGEFIFDRTFLEQKVRDIASRVHHVSYNLNALTGNAYVPLYDRFQDIYDALGDILSGNPYPLADAPVFSLSEIGWEHEQLVGIDLICLAELRHHPGIEATDGFVVSTAGVEALSTRSGNQAALANPKSFSAEEVLAAINRKFTELLKEKRFDRFLVTITLIDDGQELVTDLAGYYLLGPTAEKHSVEIQSAGQTEAALMMVAEFAIEADNDLNNQFTRCLELIVRTALSSTDSSDKRPERKRHAVFVRPAPPTLLRGCVKSRSGDKPSGDTLSITSFDERSTQEGDTLFRQRTYPFDLTSSIIDQRPAGFSFPDRKKATDAGLEKSGFGRGSALIAPGTSRSLAASAMILERILGKAVLIDWECPADGTCLITRLRPDTDKIQRVADSDLAAELSRARVLNQGGHMVQSGIAAGPVVHVTEATEPSELPAGIIAVARVASPKLTLLLPRTAAIITEHGTAAGHLATVARELRIPAVFGMPEALNILRPGMQITVNAGETTVYEGIQERLLQHGMSDGMELSPDDLEYRVLRRLLRFIMHLNLVDPEAANFAPAGCRTFHDIIHFCHEKAVEELAHFQERRPGLGAIRTYRMDLGVPMDIRVLDIGGGLSPDPAQQPTADQVLSTPFSSFLEGLLRPEAWTDDLPSLGLRDIFSSMPRTMGMLSGATDVLGENLAIVNHEYTNLSLRIGYHFSVVDAHLGSDDYRNYVYFRFAGGLADIDRRKRRANFIRNVLSAMDFSVSVKGDLVIGRLRSLEAPILRHALFVLGALTAFSRQRDTAMYSDEDTNLLFDRFSVLFLSNFEQTVAETHNNRHGLPAPEQAMAGFTAGQQWH